MTNEEKVILDRIRQLAPDGAAITVNGQRVFTAEIVCGGIDSDMGYFCAMKPDHDGQCWSKAKGVAFDQQREPADQPEPQEHLLAKYVDYGLARPLESRRQRIIEDIHLLAHTVSDDFLPLSDSWTLDTMKGLPEGKVRDRVLTLWGRYEYVTDRIRRLYAEIDNFLDEREA